MFGQNTTGLPNTDDYVLGRGRLFAAPIDPVSGKPQGYRFFGNAPSFGYSVTTENLEHTSSTGGLKVTDKEVVTQITTTVNFTVDEINGENKEIFTLGTINTAATNAAKAGFVEYEAIAAGAVVAGRSYDIVDSNGNLAMGVKAANLTVKLNNVTLTLNTDYTFDYEGGNSAVAKGGQIFLKADSTAVTTNIAGALDLAVTADGTLSDLTTVDGQTQSAQYVALLFIAENPADNDSVARVEFHRISIKPDGDYQGIGDDWSTLGFTGKAEKNNLLGGRTLTTSTYDQSAA